MATDLTPELRHAIAAAHGAPVEIVDPGSNEHYVLIRAEEYQRLQEGIVQERIEMDAGTKFALREMGRRAGWDDPVMDAYDALDPRRQ